MGGRTLYNKRFRIMGGMGELRFVDDRGVAAAERIARRAMDEAERIERKYSRFLPGSVTSRINRDAGRTPVAVDEETLDLVEAALRLAEATGGAFNPLVGVLRRAWSFKDRKVPSLQEVESLLPLLDRGQISIRHGTIFLRRAGMELDLGGVGKEYAVDRVTAWLREEGVESAVVNLSGDLATLGTRGDGRPWKVGVRDPREPGKIRFAIRLMGAWGVASSGDYERCFMKEGVRYHHLLDGRTGYPVRGVASTTVVAPTAFAAGLAATAAFLMGPEEGLAYLETRAGIEGALITEEGAMRFTSGMDRCSDLPGSLHADYPTL